MFWFKSPKNQHSSNDKRCYPYHYAPGCERLFLVSLGAGKKEHAKHTEQQQQNSAAKAPQSKHI